MPIVKCQSGREYLLELNKVVLEEMSPKVTDALTPELMDKMKAFANKVGKEAMEKMSEFDMLQHMDTLTEEEMDMLKDKINDHEIGPETIKICLRKVNGSTVYYKEIDNPFADHPGDGFKDWDHFIDRDETFIDDLPELMTPVKEKLTSFYGGVSDKGELMPSSKNGKPQKKAETTQVAAE